MIGLILWLIIITFISICANGAGFVWCLLVCFALAAGIYALYAWIQNKIIERRERKRKQRGNRL